MLGVLPVDSARSAIVHLIRSHPVTVLVGETGSGKTTRVPQYVIDEILVTPKGSRPLLCGVTQPRRVAAITVAQFVASERKNPKEVGYAVRFDDICVPGQTRIKYMTDGILLREILGDPEVRSYGVIILDEAHERTLHGDVLFGLLKAVLKRRSDLRVVVMSATLDSSKFAAFWQTEACGYVAGRQHPVQMHYVTEPVQSYIEAAVTTALQIVIDKAGTPGHILIFLTGQQDIEDAYSLLQEKKATLVGQLAKHFSFLPLKLYAALTQERQMEVFAPTQERKIILSTNIAETSLTIPGVVYVIDSGFVKEKKYHVGTGMESLQSVPCSRAQAQQRAGRAGREGPGVCYRLYTEDFFYQCMAEYTVPEIQRCSTTYVVLTLKALGIDDTLSFEFMDKPKPTAIVRSLESLLHLGALDAAGKVTEVGRRMTNYPLEPYAARALVAAADSGRHAVLEGVIVMVAMLSADGVWARESMLRDLGSGGSSFSPRTRDKFTSPYGDHFTLLNLYREYVKQPVKDRTQWCKGHNVNAREMKKALDIIHQLRSQSPALDANDTMTEDEASVAIRKALCRGYFYHAALWNQSQRAYITISGRQTVYLHPSSCLFPSKEKPPVIIYNTLVRTTKQYIHDVCAVGETQLIEAAPKLYAQS